MTVFEKVGRLTELMNRAKVSRAAGLPPTAIDAVVNKKRMPLASNGLKIARALKVPMEWLFDDKADWPPPASEAAR